MMLTYEEVQSVCHEAMRMEPDEFEKLVADHMPQSVIPTVISDVTSARMEKHGNLEIAASETANFMMGMHVGWMLAVKAVCHENG